MSFRIAGALLAFSLIAGLTVPAGAQQRPSIAIMPCQFFSADAESAEAVTQGLVQQYESQGYRVIDMSRSRDTFSQMGLSANQHYPDRVALSFGSKIGSDLVAYPRLLALGLPGATTEPNPTAPEAVVHLRVLNVHSRAPIYFRQVGHEFSPGGTEVATEFRLPQPVATAAAADVTGIYFQRVAGSRQEFRGSR